MYADILEPCTHRLFYMQPIWLHEKKKNFRQLWLGAAVLTM